MKLRQKLAVVLASAMVVTAVPVVTTAASTARITKTVTVPGGTTLGENAPELQIVVEDAITSGSQFYLTIENAKFPEVGTTLEASENVLVTVTSATEATVVITDDLSAAAENNIIDIELDGVEVTGEAKITIDGNETEVSNAGPFVFANKSDASATVDVKDATSFYTTSGSEVGTIIITEEVSNSLTGANNVIEIEMEHSDFEFTKKSTVKVKGSKGFSSITERAPEAIEISADKQTMTITLPEVTNPAGKGTFEISGITVKSIDKAPTLGDLDVTVSAKGETRVETKEITVATVKEYGTEFTVVDKKDVVAGNEVKVELSYEEVTADSIATGDVDFELSQGYIKEGTLPEGATAITKKVNGEDRIVGFTMRFRATNGKDVLLNKDAITIVTELGMEGDIVVTANGRYVEEQEVVVAEVAAGLTVETEAMVLKVGQSGQVGGKITIEETEAGEFKRGTKFEVTIPSEKGITITALPKVEATNGMEVKVSETNKDDNKVIVVEVTKVGKEAAAITIEGIEVKVDRTVPEGKFDATLAVSNLAGALTLENFVVVGTPNTEDLAANGLAKGTSTFKIGEAKYTVNGTEFEMDATSYIQNPGYTMVPVRYVATAFGVNARDILFSNGTATIFAGTRTIQFTNGSNVAIVNGVKITMSTAVVMKDGRTYAPIGEVATLLGIDKSWDNATKTATFINE